MSPEISGMAELQPEQREQEALRDSEASLETREELESSIKIDQETFEPEEAVERSGDYQQAEEIERGMAEVVQAPEVIGEMEDAAEAHQASAGVGEQDAVGGSSIAELADSPAQAQLDSAADSPEAEISTKAKIAAAAAEKMRQEKQGEGVESQVSLAIEDPGQVGIDTVVEDVGFLGEIGDPQGIMEEVHGGELEEMAEGFDPLGSEGLRSSPEESGGLPGAGFGGGVRPPENGRFDDLDSITGITDGAPGVDDSGIPDLDTSTPLNKQEDLSPRPGGADPRISEGGNQAWSGVQSWEDTQDSDGNQQIEGRERYDDGVSITTVETTHAGGTTTQTVTSTNKETGETVSETSTDNGETTTTVETTTSSNGETTTTTTVTNNETGEVVSKTTTTGGSGSSSESGGAEQDQDSTPNPEDSGGHYDFTQGGILPSPDENAPIKQPLTEDSVSQPPEGSGMDERTTQPIAMSFEDAMASHVDPYALYTEDHVDRDEAEVDKEDIKDADWTLVDPSDPEGGSGADLDDEN